MKVCSLRRGTCFKLWGETIQPDLYWRNTFKTFVNLFLLCLCFPHLPLVERWADMFRLWLVWNRTEQTAVRLIINWINKWTVEVTTTHVKCFAKWPETRTNVPGRLPAAPRYHCDGGWGRGGLTGLVFNGGGGRITYVRSAEIPRSSGWHVTLRGLFSAPRSVCLLAWAAFFTTMAYVRPFLVNACA